MVKDHAYILYFILMSGTLWAVKFEAIAVVILGLLFSFVLDHL